MTLTVAESLRQAVAHHRANQLQDAERLYRIILQAHPSHSDANHNLGTLALQTNQPAVSLPYFRAALQADSTRLEFWVNYIEALIRAKSMEGARSVLAQAQQYGFQCEALDALAKRCSTLDPIRFQAGVSGVKDNEKFQHGLQLIRESLSDEGSSLFCADNLITWNRTYGFLRKDDYCLNILRDETVDPEYKSIIWRFHVRFFFSEVASTVAGDFVELGCYKGFTPLHVIKKLDFRSLGKIYYL